jgi:hypothetical protein
MPKRGRPANEEVNRAFKRVKDADRQTDTAECLFCMKKRAWNPSRLAEHLLNCEAYQEKEACNDTVTGSKKQTTISLNAISPLQMLKIQKDLALSCYMDGLSFSAFDAKLKRLPKSILLIHGGIKFPSKTRIATRLLDGKHSVPLRLLISSNNQA